MLEISRDFTIEAAHYLPQAPLGHKCQRLHGHSFRITVALRGEVKQPEGWVTDFAAIDAAFAPLHEQLDHRYLNEVEGLENPTSENLAAWLCKRLEGALPGLRSVSVAENCHSAATCFVEQGKRRPWWKNPDSWTRR